MTETTQSMAEQSAGMQASARSREDVEAVVARFAGDSGDGMQLTGTQFAYEVAWAGNDLATLPNYPAEIRAPAGTLFGVSSFQIQFGSIAIHTPGDKVDVPPKNVVTFKPGKEMEERVRQLSRVPTPPAGEQEAVPGPATRRTRSTTTPSAASTASTRSTSPSSRARRSRTRASTSRRSTARRTSSASGSSPSSTTGRSSRRSRA